MNTYKKAAQSIVGDMPYPGNPLLLSDAKNTPKKKIKRLRDDYELMNPYSVPPNRASSSFDVEAQIEEGDKKKLKKNSFSSIDAKSANAFIPDTKKRSPSTYNEYIREVNTPDAEVIDSGWGIYDDNFKGGRRQRSKTKRRHLKKKRLTKKQQTKGQRRRKTVKKQTQKRSRGSTKKRLHRRRKTYKTR